ncbi:MAG: hypothetical protein ACUVTE_06650 [Candidatus Bathycorpusculaceae bacterium]
MECLIAYPTLLWAASFGGYLMANPSLEKIDIRSKTFKENFSPAIGTIVFKA